MQEFRFVASAWVWQGNAAWTFVTVPKGVAKAIRETLEAGKKKAFGTVKVHAEIHGTRWTTSLFPDKKSGAYLLPLKASVRKAALIQEGMPLEVLLRVD